MTKIQNLSIRLFYQSYSAGTVTRPTHLKRQSEAIKSFVLLHSPSAQLFAFAYPIPLNASAISSRMTGSSMVAGAL